MKKEFQTQINKDDTSSLELIESTPVFENKK